MVYKFVYLYINVVYLQIFFVEFLPRPLQMCSVLRPVRMDVNKDNVELMYLLVKESQLINCSILMGWLNNG